MKQQTKQLRNPKQRVTERSPLTIIIGVIAAVVLGSIFWWLAWMFIDVLFLGGGQCQVNSCQ